MIAFIIIMIIMNASNGDDKALDELLRRSNASYTVGDLEEAEEYLEEYMEEFPDSHLGQMMRVLIRIREGCDNEAHRLLVELNSCDIESPECDSPVVHVAAYILLGTLNGSESMFMKSEELISEITDELYKDYYKAQIDIYLAENDPQRVCIACDEYMRISDYIPSSIAMNCFVSNWSRFDVEAAEKYWNMLSVVQKEELRGTYGDLGSRGIRRESIYLSSKAGE